MNTNIHANLETCDWGTKCQAAATAIVAYAFLAREDISDSIEIRTFCEDHERMDRPTWAGDAKYRRTVLVNTTEVTG